MPYYDRKRSFPSYREIPKSIPDCDFTKEIREAAEYNGPLKSKTRRNEELIRGFEAEVIMSQVNPMREVGHQWYSQNSLLPFSNNLSLTSISVRSEQVPVETLWYPRAIDLIPGERIYASVLSASRPEYKAVGNIIPFSQYDKLEVSWNVSSEYFLLPRELKSQEEPFLILKRYRSDLTQIEMNQRFMRHFIREINLLRIIHSNKE